MRIIQVLDALDYGDGVSNDVINKHKLFQKMGYTSLIYSKWVDDRVSNIREDIKLLKTNKTDILIYHYSGFSHIFDSITEQRAYKVFLYHNITPPEMLEKDTQEEYEKALNQIKRSNSLFDYFLGDSRYNVECLKNIGITKKCDVLPIAIDFNYLTEYKNLNGSVTDNEIFIFVGRVARNKRHEDIIDVFNFYNTKYNKDSLLYLVGNTDFDVQYFELLKQKVHDLGLDNNIIFTGKVSSEKLVELYAKSKVFLCMSEHEGFCIPLLESMYMETVTIAYNSSAISSTMTGSGVLVNTKNPEILSKLIYTILTTEISESIIEKQSMNIQKYFECNMTLQLEEYIKEWRD